MVETVSISVNVRMDPDGKWIAFGQSDNSKAENRAVNTLRTGTLASGSVDCTVDLTIPLSAFGELADVG